MKYKSKVENSITNYDITKHKDYDKSVEAINNANVDQDTYSFEYFKVISEFPEMTLSNVPNKITVKLEKHILDMLYIEVYLKDTKLKFLLDTGAEVSCIGVRNAIDTNGIVKSDESVHVGGAGGYFSEMQICYAQDLDVSGIKIKNIPMLVLNEKQLSLNMFGKNVMNVDGVLGWDVLKHLDFILDFNNLQLDILPTKLTSTKGNFIKSIFPVVLCMDKNNNIKTFGVDIGARKSWLSEKIVMEDQLKVIYQKRRKIYGVNGFVIQTTSIINKYALQIEDSTLTFKNISTGFTGLLNSYDLDGVLGIDLLKNKKLIIMNSENMMRFE